VNRKSGHWRAGLRRRVRADAPHRSTRRRLIIALGAGALGIPFGTPAQRRLSRIGFLGAISASAYAQQVEGLRAGLRDAGYIEGKNLAIEFRWAEGRYERLPELAAELVRAGVQVTVTHGTPGTQAARKATSSVPIVIAIATDLVANGIVASLARPGGNVTGTTFFNGELGAKRLEMLKEVVPATTQAAVLVNPENPSAAMDLKTVEAAAGTLKVALQRMEVRDVGAIEGAIEAMAKSRSQAFVFFEDATLLANSARIAALAAKQRLPAAGNREFAEAGGLIGYGVNFYETFRRAAYFVDRILKGAKAGDIPVEQASKFELVLNIKAAKALGIKVPQSVLVRADRVIE
jgi:putative ABC transport system substrate-binding protein